MSISADKCLAMPVAGLSFADLSLAVLECDGNKVRTAKRLGVGIRSLDAVINREGLQRWFAQNKGIFNRNMHKRKRTACVTREQITELALEGYLKSDAAAILGISPYYLRDLIEKWGITEFSENRGERSRIGKNGYCR